MPKLICAWCGKIIATEVRTDDGRDTHGVCKMCRDQYLTPKKEKQDGNRR